MITKESLLFHGIESSSRSGDLLPVTRRNALLKAAFLLGNRGEKREIIAAIRGAAEIPPAVKWDAETIKDCVANYYFENNRYPRVFDLCLLNCLPTAETIKYVFGVSAQRWLDGYRCFVVGFESEAAGGQGTGKRKKKKIARITRKQALLAAESVLEGEEKERVREMIAEYPIAEWNERNVADVLISFYEKYGRVPAEREMKNSCELPYYGIFRYRFHTTYRAFLREFLPPLYEIYCGGANERNNAEISGAVSGTVSGGAKKQGAKSAERKRKAETKRGEPKRGKTKSGKIKSIKIIRVDFGGSVFYPTFSNVQDYYFWEEEKKYKDTFILDYFLNKSARKATGETLPENAPDNAPDKAMKNAPVNDTDNAQGKAMKNAPGNAPGNATGNARKVARHGKPVGSRFAAWDKSWEIAQKTARLTERENAQKNTPQNALKNTPPTDSIHASPDGRTGDPIGDPTGVPIGDPTGGRRNFRGNAR